MCELCIPMSKPLRVGITELVVSYLKTSLATGGQIDVAAMTHEIVQSLVDVIMKQERRAGVLIRLRPNKLGRGISATAGDLRYKPQRALNTGRTSGSATALYFRSSVPTCNSRGHDLPRAHTSRPGAQV